ncbi:hypothetical protein Daus18300_005740 [Diaporthe australafricana]|uniref:Uncharacterized protein n=1 Tax=Diaporthe australafricana TaxID=127596 RepID=A0ABR3WZB8_9PEZI
MADQQQPGTPTKQDDGDYRICTRCHRRIPLAGFTRSAAESDSDNFNLKLMTTCNYCALRQRNQRALGKYEDKDIPKTDRKTHVLTEAQTGRWTRHRWKIQVLGPEGPSNNFNQVASCAMSTHLKPPRHHQRLKAFRLTWNRFKTCNNCACTLKGAPLLSPEEFLEWYGAELHNELAPSLATQ